MSLMISDSYLGVIMPSIGVCAHPAGIRTAIAVKNALVIARWRHRQKRFSVRQNDERKFVALERMLQQHARTAGAELMVLHQPPDECLGLSAIFRNEHALARAQSIRLDHHRPIHGVQTRELLPAGIQIRRRASASGCRSGS